VELMFNSQLLLVIWYSNNQAKHNGLFIIQHFFGGAMGVFTTRTLLSSVGVSQSKVTPGAIAINWILKVKISCPFMSSHFSCSPSSLNNVLKSII
jgi:hypothetical protein